VPFRRHRRALVCRQAVALLTDYLEEALAPADRARLEAHLAECPHCREYLAQLRTTIATVGMAGPDDLDPAAVDDLVALYRRWSAGQRCRRRLTPPTAGRR
jgi:anti-sigma factor RsiW